MENMIFETSNQYYVSLDTDNRIRMVTTAKQSDDMILFDFPSDFDVTSHINYKIIDNELVYDKFAYPEIVPQPTEEQKKIAENTSNISELQDYTADLLYQVCLLQLGVTEEDL